VEAITTRVAPSLEAVSGTLTQLCIDKSLPGAWPGEVEVGYELGVAVGKLRRLKDLAIGLLEDGRAYHAVAQGLAAGGGDRPLPLLRRLGVVLREVDDHADLLTSLLLPGVRVFGSIHYNVQSALLMACALRKAGFRHTWAECFEFDTVIEHEDALRAIVECKVVSAIATCRDWDFSRFN
jgi:hypothetical protein